LPETTIVTNNNNNASVPKARPRNKSLAMCPALIRFDVNTEYKADSVRPVKRRGHNTENARFEHHCGARVVPVLHIGVNKFLTDLQRFFAINFLNISLQQDNLD